MEVQKQDQDPQRERRWVGTTTDDGPRVIDLRKWKRERGRDGRDPTPPGGGGSALLVPFPLPGLEVAA